MIYFVHFDNTRTQDQCDTGEGRDGKHGGMEHTRDIDKVTKNNWHKKGSDVSERRDETHHTADRRREMRMFRRR